MTIIPIAAINYNGHTDTIALIDSLAKSGEAFDLIIVDNQSPQKGEINTIHKHVTEKYIAAQSDLDYTNEHISGGCVLKIDNEKIVTLIQGTDNFGFACGTNIGLRYALKKYPNEEFLTILNNDTEVSKLFLTKVISAMEKFNLAAAMGTILYYGYDKPYIWSIGGPMDFVKGQGVHVLKDSLFNPDSIKQDFVERQFISGCFTVFRRKPLLEIGLLDEDYFFAGEEYQYSYDLSKKYRIGWIPESIIYHKSIKGIGNGSSHKISDLKWQYNAYMVKVVFVNKNKSHLYRVMWHILFKLYILTKIRMKYNFKSEKERKGYNLLRKEIFKRINATKFTKDDFEAFTKIVID